MREVVCHYDNNALEIGQQARLKQLAKESGSDLEFILLRNAVADRAHLRRAILISGRADYIGLKEIGNPYAVLWQPSPTDANLFKKLVEEGYEGKRVLIYLTEKIPGEFGVYATHSFEISAKNLGQNIFNALNRP